MTLLNTAAAIKAKWKVFQLNGDLASGASVTPTVVIGDSVYAPAGWIVAIPTA